MSDLQGNLAALAREIGADVPKMDAFEVLAEWARRMAGAVAHHADHGCEYRDRIMPWALEVVRANTSDMASVCRRVADAITGVDCDDGWPTDKTGEALHAVCLSGHIGLTDNHTHLAALDAAECAPITYRVDQRLIADAQAALDAGEVPVRQRMAVYAAIRQAREFPQLAMQYDAVGVLLRAV